MYYSTPRLLGAFFAALTLSNAAPTPTPTTTGTFFQIGSGAAHQGPISKRNTQADYVAFAQAGINQMQTWYDASTGLWSGLWWNSANALTMLADFQMYFPTYATPTTNVVFPSTLANAATKSGNTGFLNEYYDDELWWVLAWIQVYDVTGNVDYLNTAAGIFEDPKNAWGSTPCGGLWWDKSHTQIGAVENELYLTAAAKLANRLPNANGGGYYFNEAIKAYNWFVGSGLINAQGTINNGLVIDTCKNDGNIVFSYNQGILLSGLTELTWSTGNDTYNELANSIALAAITALTNSAGILTEQCEPSSCDGDEMQFKGVFGRNIAFMYARANVLPASTAATYKTFLQTNADSIWAYDQVNDMLGLVWSGPEGSATLQSQSSALDAVVGAAWVS